MSHAAADSAPGDAVLIGVDWGTTHLRAYQIDANGEILARRQSPLGIASVRSGGFDDALSSVIHDWRTGERGNTPVLMCGMIGSRQGWREVPYLPCPARLQRLAAAVEPIETSTGPVAVVGGLETRDARHRHDVMRGEETQILGVAPPTGAKLVITPGTHSKWAVVRDGTLESFRTYLTGEVYAVLRQHSILGWLLRGEEHARTDEVAFLEGLQEAVEEPDWLHALFSVRTRGLFETKTAAALGSYLSGLLIGCEVQGAARHHHPGPVVVIAASDLARLYGLALAAVGYPDVQCVDGSDAAARGLWQLWRARTEKARP